MFEIIPNWHPIWVHFAVAMLITSAALFFLFGWSSSRTRQQENALIVARWTLRLGVFAAAGALLTGYLASGSVAHDDISHANMMVHRGWAFAATTLFVIAALSDYIRRKESKVSVFSIVLLVSGSVALTMTSLEGAENVYQYGLGVQRLPDTSTHKHSRTSEKSSHEHAEAPGETHENADSTKLPLQHDHDRSAHAPAQSTLADSNTGDAQHPASLLATRFGSAIAKGDVDTLRSLLAPDVLIFESGGVESSLAEYEQHHMTADMAFMKHMQVELLSRQVLDLGETAAVVTQSRVHGRYQNREFDLKSTETLVMKSVDGQWKIIHIHWSSS